MPKTVDLYFWEISSKCQPWATIRDYYSYHQQTRLSVSPDVLAWPKYHISCAHDVAHALSEIKGGNEWPDYQQRGFCHFSFKISPFKKEPSVRGRTTSHEPRATYAEHSILWFYMCLCFIFSTGPPVRFSLSARNLSRVLKTVCANLFFDLTYIYSWCWQVSLSSHIRNAWLSRIDSLQLISSWHALYLMFTSNSSCSVAQPPSVKYWNLSRFSLCPCACH